LCSMDDEFLYGPEFHRLGFGKAVAEGLLTDYKVLILTVDEKYIASSLQSQVADENTEINLDDAVKIVGCWNGLAKRSGRTPDGEGFPPGSAPMCRAVAFSRSIKESTKLADSFADVINSYDDADEASLRCEVRHVDGTFNALQRNAELDWLKTDAEANTCRILSNARCLSEGVDMPDLDAVLFLNPRNSVVDVVQSVGRVMRKAEGKEYGYIILPIGIPTDVAPDKALSDNKRYKVVWQVLQALRAHDDRFNATVNQIELNKKKPDNIMIGTVGFDGDGGDGSTNEASRDNSGKQATLDFPVGVWRDAIYAKIVTKVGERAYWENWAKDVAAIAERHVMRITALVDDPASGKQAAFERFLDELRSNINPGVTKSNAIDMLAQHLITKPVFDALFAGYDFSTKNPVSQTMQTMLDILGDQALGKEVETLESFYASVRVRAEGIDNHEGRQKVITELYEKFFKTALPKTADAFGIIYTPIPIVDFILRATNQALERHFGTSLSARGVQIIDPFTGTGTFIVRLLQSGLITPDDMRRKYTSELHANEI
ncbi:MAG: helicase-related protein, partial [Sciscionella sp.]